MLEVNTGRLNTESESIGKIAGNIAERMAEMKKISYNLSIDSSAAPRIIAQINVSSSNIMCKVQLVRQMATALYSIAEMYAVTERKIVENAKSISSGKRLINLFLNKDDLNPFNDSDVDFSSMTYDEIIQYRIDHAVDEKTKLAYLKYLEKLKIKEDDLKGTAYYHSIWNEIHYNKEEDNVDPRGAGNCYFHEFGHMVDDRSDWFGHTSTDGHYDFYDKLSEDVDRYISDIMKGNGFNKDAAYNYLSDWLRTDANKKNGVSDLVNGITTGKACGVWAHNDSYYTQKSICNEAFAHFFEAGMSNNPTKLEYIKEIFPSAYEEFQRMLEDDLK